MKIKGFVLILLFLLFSTSTFANNILSEKAEISLLTCDKGYELYSAYGHSAIRVKDPINNIDVVFNYGTFDYNTDNFLGKFIKGTLDYSLSTERFEWFLDSYINDNRGIIEQVFDLTIEEKQSVFDRLIINYETDERNYRYDFFYDNCSSRIHEIIKEVLGEELVYGENLNENSAETFRNLIEPAFDFSPWTTFGVYLIMSYPTDNVATNKQKMFLPIHMMERFDMATYKGNQFIKSKRILFESKAVNFKNSFYLSPIFIFTLIFLIVTFISYKNYKAKKHYYSIDYFLLLITGLIGIFFLFMWFGTRHSPTFQNMNMFWAMPLNLLAIFFLKNKKFKNYFLFMAILNTVGFFILPQVFHIAIIPISLMMTVRYLKLYFFD